MKSLVNREGGQTLLRASKPGQIESVHASHKPKSCGGMRCAYAPHSSYLFAAAGSICKYRRTDSGNVRHATYKGKHQCGIV
ncbi:MAG: hypothetical protein KA134_09055, partial [Achromobacter sp.]|nr:hypothetical protein [Achromobacter sp.]